jgi:hypothetical protein
LRENYKFSEIFFGPKQFHRESLKYQASRQTLRSPGLFPPHSFHWFEMAPFTLSGTGLVVLFFLCNTVTPAAVTTTHDPSHSSEQLPQSSSSANLATSSDTGYLLSPPQIAPEVWKHFTRTSRTLADPMTKATKASAKFLIVAGSKVGSVRFNFVCSDGRTLMESRDLLVGTDVGPVVELVGAAMQVSTNRGLISQGGLSDTLGFVIRDALSRVIAFSILHYDSPLDMQDDIDIVVREAASAKITIDQTTLPKSLEDESIIKLSHSDQTFRFHIMSAIDDSEVQSEDFSSKSACVFALGRYLSSHQTTITSIVDDINLPPAPKTARRKSTWDTQNNPWRVYLGGKEIFELNYDNMVANNWTRGWVNVMPWPETYWATFNDGLNFRWQDPSSCESEIDCLSPLEKYDFGYNSWRPNSTYFSLKIFDVNTCSTSDPKAVSLYIYLFLVV